MVTSESACQTMMASSAAETITEPSRDVPTLRTVLVCPSRDVGWAEDRLAAEHDHVSTVGRDHRRRADRQHA